MTEQSTLTLTCADPCEPCDECCECESSSITARPGLRRAAWALTAATIAWNSIEAVVAMVSGFLAGLIAFVGFGLESAAGV